MPIIHAIVLGLTQGFAEFLPISSSGHLELVPWLFGWDDFAGDEQLENSFDVALHIGTLVGAIAYLWSDVCRYTVAGLGAATRRREWTTDARVAWALVLSAVPAAIVGVALEDLLLDLSGNIWMIATLLIVFGLLLLAADQIPTSAGSSRTADQFTVRDALLMGGGQAAALWPGVSRSGVTVTVGRAIGFDRSSTARLAFLMSLPVILGAGVFRGVDIVRDGLPDGMVAPFAAGMITSAITGWVAVWGTLRYVRTRSFTPFVIYRVVAGLAVMALLVTNVR